VSGRGRVSRRLSTLLELSFSLALLVLLTPLFVLESTL
jgi:hypothetical protein